jgi:multiple sugar transport system substrate-binding protein
MRTGPETVTYLAGQPETNPQGKSWLDLLVQFNQTNTQQITVNLGEARATTSVEKLKVLSAAGTPPDFATIAYFSGPELYTPNATIDVDTVLKKDRRWAKQRADIFPDLLDRPMWGDKLTSLPANLNVQAVTYSPGLLARAGVAAPKAGWTWNDLREAAQRAGRPPDTWGFTFEWNTPTLQIWVGSMGSGLVSADRRKMLIDTSETIETVEFLTGLVRGQISNAEGKNGLFQQGNNATVFQQEGGFVVANLRQLGIADFQIVPAPVHPVKKVLAGSAGGWNLALFKGVPTERQDAAGEVLLWLNAPEQQARQCVQSTTLPVSKAALNSSYYQDAIRNDPQYKVFVDIVPAMKGRSFPGMPSHDANRAAIQRVIREIFSGKVGLRAALTELQRETQQMLDQDLRTLG